MSRAMRVANINNNCAPNTPTAVLEPTLAAVYEHHDFELQVCNKVTK